MGAAARIGHNLGGHRSGNDWVMLCPLCGDYPLALTDGEHGLLAHCYGEEHPFDEILAAIAPFGLLDGDDDRTEAPSIIRPRKPDAVRIKNARRIYEPLGSALGTPAEIYIRVARRITILLPSILRFGLCPHRLGGVLRAMALPIVDVEGEQTAIHMTYLREDGSDKADLPHKDLQRETRGVVRGGMIRLAEYDPGLELLVAEGVENTFSGMEIFSLPGWSAVSAGGLKSADLPSEVRRIVLAVDNDHGSTGQRNAAAAYQRWTEEKRSVRIVMPPLVGTDFNDVLMERATRALPGGGSENDVLRRI
jgi:hypothetical protein